jgi:uncharacterized protein (DUF2235 family)
MLMGSMFGWGLESNLRDGYRFLMNNFQHGDQLYLFGFSRGAYTARALAGMLYYFGLLERGSENLIPYVTKYYVKQQFDRAQGFKQTFCRPCNPHFIGVWDTVKSIDYFGNEKFYDAELKDNVTYGYQAISIDEKRSKFQVSLWDDDQEKPHQQIEQVWFPGVHSDVGGGYPEGGLSDISLGWMMDRAADKGLLLKEGWGELLDQNAEGLLHRSYKSWWKLLGTKLRRIPENAAIHQSVFDRIQQVSGYRPDLPDSYNRVSNSSYPEQET